MKKLASLLIVLIMLAALFCSCGSTITSESYTPSAYNYYNTDGTYAMFNYSSEDKGYTTATGTTPPIQQDDITTTNEENVQKIIKTYQLSLETLNCDVATLKIISTVAAMGGYIQSSTENNSSIKTSTVSSRYAYYVIRVPSVKLDDYVGQISVDCNVQTSQLSTQDITDTYYGLQSQLDSLILQKERIEAMMATANNLDTLIKLDDKFTSVTAEINTINSQLQRYDKSVDYSYVYITLYEVNEYQPEENVNFFVKVGRAFVGAFEVFVNVIASVFLGIVWALPFLILLVIAAVITIVCVRRNNKKRKESEKK